MGGVNSQSGKLTKILTEYLRRQAFSCHQGNGIKLYQTNVIRFLPLALWNTCVTHNNADSNKLVMFSSITTVNVSSAHPSFCSCFCTGPKSSKSPPMLKYNYCVVRAHLC